MNTTVSQNTNMSAVTPHSAGTEETPALRTEDDALTVVHDNLMTLSEKMTVCDRILSDLKDLGDVLVRKSLQDLTLPLQKGPEVDHTPPRV